MTGLPNRLAFNENLQELRKSREHMAILFMDLNGFKAINDEFGHKVGDEVLRQIANLATKYKRPQDHIARLGGDEFNLIFTGEDAEQTCLTYCSDLQHALTRSLKVGDLVFQPRIAMGYTLGDGKSESLSEMMRQADYAMYAAKSTKQQAPVRYELALEEDELREAEISKALRSALESKSELSVVYQPIISRTSGKMALAEALVRWTSPQLGPIPPDAFISVPEKTGLIVELGRQVIEMVYQDLSELPGLNVSINLSPIQLRSRSILQDIDRLTTQYRIDPKRVTFEVTENVLVEDPDMTSFLLDKLKEQGFGLALDDFGVGFSSIGYLRQFSFDKLKVDKSFVDDIGVASNNGNLMKALVYLARSLNMQIVAEGVETEAQSDSLSEEKYDLLQGYLFSRPLPLERLRDFFAKDCGGEAQNIA